MADLWQDYEGPISTRRPALTDTFVVPPFSVLDTKQGYWRERREAWLTLGIQSELGRGDMTTALDVSQGVVDAKDFTNHPSHRATASPWTRGQADFVSQAMAGIERGQQTSRQTGDVLVPGGQTLTEAERERAERLKGYAGGPARANLPDPDRMRHIEAARREADLRSNLTGAAPLPEYADFGTANVAPGTSIFDPVLCEIILRWWMPAGGAVLDPFAGGSVRGIVAGMLGHRYTGIDLSDRQVEANRMQARDIKPASYPRWITGDARDLEDLLPAGQLYEGAFSCPPYFDLEVYSDDPRDLSCATTYADFLDGFGTVIHAVAQRLVPSSFFALVVSDVRDKRGMYHGLPADTVNLGRAAGLQLYNEAVLLNPAGTLPMRVARQFEAGRKLGRSHQNVLVFLKGDPPKGWDHQRPAPPPPQTAMWPEQDLAPAPVTG